MNNIKIEDVLKLGSNANIIDIRGKINFNNGHIDNAINIPYEELLTNYSKYLDKNKVYYIYCSRGTKSVKLCSFLYLKGYKVVNILGGYQAWILLK